MLKRSAISKLLTTKQIKRISCNGMLSDQQYIFTAKPQDTNVKKSETRGMVPLLTSLPPLTTLPPSCLPAYCHHLPLASPQSTSSANSLPCEEARRRGEKRPIPSELKDEKYFERRRRNNQAAKKSRDARRMREDQIAWRACVLEQENASLRAHVSALTQETRALRALLARDDAPTSTTD